MRTYAPHRLTQVTDALRNAGKPMNSDEISAAIGLKSRDTIRVILADAKDKGKIVGKRAGPYVVLYCLHEHEWMIDKIINEIRDAYKERKRFSRPSRPNAEQQAESWADRMPVQRVVSKWDAVKAIPAGRSVFDLGAL